MPVSAAISSASASLVSGPVATIRESHPAMAGHLFAPHLDQRLARDGARDLVGEDVAIHRQRVPAGHARFRGRLPAAANPGAAIPPSAATARYSCSLFSELLHTSSASRSV